MGCCGSRPVEDDAPQAGRQNVTAQGSRQTRQAPHAITSQTAINNGDDQGSRSLAPQSGHSIHPSETSRSALSTPGGSVQESRSRPHRQASLAARHNLPLVPPKTWKSKDRRWSRSQLLRERYEFFETRVTGRKEIWNGLKQAIECIQDGELGTAQVLLDAMSVTLPTGKIEDGAYDENGSLYKIPQAVVSDPTDVDEDIHDVDSQTFTDTSDIDTITSKLKAAEGGALDEGKQDLVGEKARAAKGKTAIRDAVKIKCRLSDRGSPECDVIIVLDRSEKLGVLSHRIHAERIIPSKASLRFVFLGKMLDEKQTLAEQGWKDGNVIQVLVLGDWK